MPEPKFQCLECGKVFYSIKSAERATEEGCPNCGGVDIDIWSPPEESTNPSNGWESERFAPENPDQNEGREK